MTPTMPMGAGFFSLRNPCRADVVLTGAQSRRFADVSMHESRLEGGISRMRPLGGVRLHAGEHVDFQPGGRHLMLAAPDSRLQPDGRARIELVFADGRRLPVDFEVRPFAP